MKRIEIEYYEDGTTRLEVFGVDGPGCMGLTKDIEARHGTVKQITHKSEFFDKDSGVVDTSKLCG